jgi:hypothetical protein
VLRELDREDGRHTDCLIWAGRLNFDVFDGRRPFAGEPTLDRVDQVVEALGEDRPLGHDVARDEADVAGDDRIEIIGRSVRRRLRKRLQNRSAILVEGLHAAGRGERAIVAVAVDIEPEDLPTVAREDLSEAHRVLYRPRRRLQRRL